MHKSIRGHLLVIKFGHVLSGSIAICTIDPLQCLVACLVLGKKGTLKAACVFKVLNGSSMCLRSICLLVRENIIIILQRYIRTCWLCGIIHIARFSVEKKTQLILNCVSTCAGLIYFLLIHTAVQCT